METLIICAQISSNASQLFVAIENEKMSRGSILSLALFAVLLSQVTATDGSEDSTIVTDAPKKAVEQELKPPPQLADEKKTIVQTAAEEKPIESVASSPVAEGETVTKATTAAAPIEVAKSAGSSNDIPKAKEPEVPAAQDKRRGEASGEKSADAAENIKATQPSEALPTQAKPVEAVQPPRATKQIEEVMPAEKKAEPAPAADGGDDVKEPVTKAVVTPTTGGSSSSSNHDVVPKPVAKVDATTQEEQQQKENDKKPHEDKSPGSPYNQKIIANPPLDPEDDLTPRPKPPQRPTAKPPVEDDAGEDVVTPPKLTPAKEATTPEGGSTPVDESLYKFTEASLSLEMKIFEGVMYGVAAAVVITLLYRGLDAAGLNKEFFLRFVAGTSKLALVGRGLLHVASFIGWLVASAMMLIFEGVVCLCKKKQFTPPIQVPTQIATSSAQGTAHTSGMKLGGSNAAAAKKPLIGKKPTVKSNEDGWSNAWSDEDDTRRR